MTVAVIGIAISLPAGMHTLVNKVQQVSGNWEGSASISVFLQPDISDSEAEALATELGLRASVGDLRYVSRNEAMDEFRRFSGFGAALDLLQENPLPPVLIIRPAKGHDSPEQTESLAGELESLPAVELAQVDLRWVRRLHAITQIAARAAMVLGVLLSAAVLLIVGNTIRLEIQNRHTEIEITKLVGASNAFIRRPFLYDGLWYGLMGGIIAWLLITLSFSLLQGPIENLAGLYQQTYALTALSLDTSLVVLLGSPLLGLIGAWIAVGQHLSHIEPS